MRYGMKLSPEQQAVVDHRGSDLQVIACAGSGKTHAVTEWLRDRVLAGPPTRRP
jgi:superfamily I DNA/RNA helicase